MSDLLIEITLALSYFVGALLIASIVTLARVFDCVINFYEDNV